MDTQQMMINAQLDRIEGAIKYLGRVVDAERVRHDASRADLRELTRIANEVEGLAANWAAAHIPAPEEA